MCQLWCLTPFSTIFQLYHGKADLAKTLREKVISRSSSIAEECGADEMNLVR
jgi:hypothetical protein